MVCLTGKITGKSRIYARLDKPPAGPPHFWLDKNARGLSSSAEPIMITAVRHVPISRKKNQKRKIIDKETSRTGNDE